jgi:hypothetical protein
MIKISTPFAFQPEHPHMSKIPACFRCTVFYKSLWKWFVYLILLFLLILFVKVASIISLSQSSLPTDLSLLWGWAGMLSAAQTLQSHVFLFSILTMHCLSYSYQAVLLAVLHYPFCSLLRLMKAVTWTTQTPAYFLTLWFCWTSGRTELFFRDLYFSH